MFVGRGGELIIAFGEIGEQNGAGLARDGAGHHRMGVGIGEGDGGIGDQGRSGHVERVIILHGHLQTAQGVGGGAELERDRGG